MKAPTYLTPRAVSPAVFFVTANGGLRGAGIEPATGRTFISGVLPRRYFFTFRGGINPPAQ